MSGQLWNKSDLEVNFTFGKYHVIACVEFDDHSDDEEILIKDVAMCIRRQANGEWIEPGKAELREIWDDIQDEASLIAIQKYARSTNEA